jgi:hypothetical protein
MFGKRIWKYICLSALPALLLACREEASYVERPSLATVGEIHLYKDDADIMYALQHRTDSAEFMKNYVERWAMDVLFYEKAKANVMSTDEIERMVESYRKSLIENLYQDRLITQQLVPSITDSEVQEFYDQQHVLFELTEPYIKGYYVKIPNKSPKVRDVRNLCIRKGQDDLEELEKLCTENAYEYQFFLEEWIPFVDLVRKTPLTNQQLMDRLLGKNLIEFKDGGFTYFVFAESILKKNDIKPIEMVSGEIRELLINSKKADFIKSVKRSLYEEALKNGTIVIH